jgi:hypothetical protein
MVSLRGTLYFLENIGVVSTTGSRQGVCQGVEVESRPLAAPVGIQSRREFPLSICQRQILSRNANLLKRFSL